MEPYRRLDGKYLKKLSVEELEEEIINIQKWVDEAKAMLSSSQFTIFSYEEDEKDGKNLDFWDSLEYDKAYMHREDDQINHSIALSRLRRAEKILSQKRKTSEWSDKRLK